MIGVLSSVLKTLCIPASLSAPFIKQYMGEAIVHGQCFIQQQTCLMLSKVLDSPFDARKASEVHTQRINAHPQHQ